MAKHFEDFDANLAGEEGKTEETKTSWFKRIKKGIHTSTSEKKGKMILYVLIQNAIITTASGVQNITIFCLMKMNSPSYSIIFVPKIF